MGVKAELVDCVLKNLLAQILGNALDSSVVDKMLLDSHLIEDQIFLRAVADQLSCLFKVSLDIET